MSIEAFPLCWPIGRKRVGYRSSSRFDTSFAKSRDRCLAEIRALGGSQSIISSNLPLRLDWLPYAKTPPYIDPAVAVYFTYKNRQICFACDRWDDVRDNMHAISLTIAALRGIARWGTGDMMEAAFTGFAALPAPGQTTARGWREVLELNGTPTMDEAKLQYRKLSSVHHPDRGGSQNAMSELNWAWAQAQEQLK